MSLKRFIPRDVVRVKNELIARARYRLDRRVDAVARSSEPGRYISYVTTAGLANRLRAHYLASCIARITDRTVVPLWLPTKELASDGRDIFDVTYPAPVRRRSVHVARASGSRRDLLDAARAHHDRLLFLDFDAQWIDIETTRRTMQPDGPVAIAVHDRVLDETRGITSDLTGPVLAVHVRQTDFRTHTPFAKPLAYFEEEIERRLAGRRFRTIVVASDDDVDLSGSLRARFDRVVVMRPRFRRDEHGVAAEALAHLLVLATADDLIPSPASSFSELASAIRTGVIEVPGLPRITAD